MGSPSRSRPRLPPAPQRGTEEVEEEEEGGGARGHGGRGRGQTRKKNCKLRISIMSRLLKSLLSPTSSAPPRPAGLPPGGAPRSSYSAQIGFTSFRLDRPRHPVNTRDSCLSPAALPPCLLPDSGNEARIKCRAHPRRVASRRRRKTE